MPKPFLPVCQQKSPHGKHTRKALSLLVLEKRVLLVLPHVLLAWSSLSSWDRKTIVAEVRFTIVKNERQTRRSMRGLLWKQAQGFVAAGVKISDREKLKVCSRWRPTEQSVLLSYALAMYLQDQMVLQSSSNLFTIPIAASMLLQWYLLLLLLPPWLLLQSQRRRLRGKMQGSRRMHCLLKATLKSQVCLRKTGVQSGNIQGKSMPPPIPMKDEKYSGLMHMGRISHKSKSSNAVSHHVGRMTSTVEKPTGLVLALYNDVGSTPM